MKTLSKIIILNCYKRKLEGQIMKKLIETSVKGMGIEVEISYDKGDLGIWGNFKQAVNIPSSPEKFRMIMHDDILITRASIKKAIKVLDNFPKNCFVSLYSPDNQGYRNAAKNGHRLLKTYSNWWSQTMCFSSELTKPMIKWIDQKIKPGYKWEDGRITLYTHTKKVPIYSLIPSLVQHLGAYRSTFGIPGKIGKLKRYSSNYLASQDVDIDWEKEIKNAYRSDIPSNVAHPSRWLK